MAIAKTTGDDSIDESGSVSHPNTAVARKDLSSRTDSISAQEDWVLTGKQVTPKKRRRDNASIDKTEPVRISPSSSAKVPARSYIDDLSSDSSLSDPPSDLDLGTESESDADEESPFFPNPPTPVRSVLQPPPTQVVKIRRPTTSPYFTKQVIKRITCLPFPPLAATKFGLMQEKLAYDPFRLLVATIFLNRTRGEQAMPAYFQLMERYPTVESMAKADVKDITAMIQKLGFQNQRARKLVELAKAWLNTPPMKGKRFRKINYPLKGNGRDIKAGEVVTDEDDRVAWEIANLPGLGSYALDSWRIFCRDKLRGLSKDWNGDGAPEGFEPEWKRVVPTDKELRAYLTWMWLKLGYVWNKETGEKTKADSITLGRVREGGVVHDEGAYLVLITSVAEAAQTSDSKGRSRKDGQGVHA